MQDVLTADSAVQGVSAVKLNMPGCKETEVQAKVELAETKADASSAGLPGLSAALPAMSMHPPDE